MDRRVIDEKLESLRRCVDRIRTRCPEDSSLLVSDPDLQDIVSLNLTRAVQLCVDIAAIVISESPLPAPTPWGRRSKLSLSWTSSNTISRTV